MRIVVPVDRNHGSSDSLTEFQELAALSQLLCLRQYVMKLVLLAANEFRSGWVLDHRVILVSSFS